MPSKKGGPAGVDRGPNSLESAVSDDAYRSLAGLEGMPIESTVSGRLNLETLRRLYPGVLAAATAAVAATWLAQHYQSPVMLLALLFGLALNFLYQDRRCVPGIDFASKSILRCGVALVGARLTVDQIIDLGPAPVLMVIGAIVSTLVVGSLGARMLRLPTVFGVLSSGAVAICGASAALAISAVLPHRKETQRDTVLAVVMVTTLSTIAMVLYPAITAALGLSDRQAGMFLGGTIHDVAQVVGAGYTVSPAAGDVATVIKLLRVAMLLPLVIVLAFIFRAGGKVKGRLPIPLFLLGFAALVIVHSSRVLPEAWLQALYGLSQWLLAIAIVALGMKSSLKALVTVGWRPLALMAAETVWIAVAILAAVLLLP